ncbi:MAG: AAA family ATPase [Geobacteraceae bacterium]|nr:AAA family ATPase [Geobacteraceae bacterium]
MYLDYFGFKEPPFTLTPNPDFLFLSRCHQEAYAHLLYAIESRAGFIELSGEVGTGKTTLVRTLLTQLSPEKYKSALIFNPTLSPLTLLQEVNREFGLPFACCDTRELHQSLNEFLISENSEDRTVVLVIDEAQNLSRDVLEQVRLISNLETEREKLIQIVLVGQTELKTLLARDDLRQLSQRITVRYHLDRMDEADIHGYIRHRIRIAAEGREPVSFTGAALKKITGSSKGLPRLINSICDRALLLAYTKDAKEVSAKMAKTAIIDLFNEIKPYPYRLIAAVTASFLIFAVICVGYLQTGKAQAPAPAPAVTVQVQPQKPPELLGGVRLLQEMLRSAGHFSGTSTGVFDAATEAAVKSFQRKEGLAVDGRPGGQTLMRLYQKTGGEFSPYSTAQTVKGEVPK